MRPAPIPATLAFLAFCTLASADDPGTALQAPLDVGRSEQVEVELVLVDVLPLDRRGRTVPNLGRDDFQLSVDWRPVEIVSVDSFCEESVNDPKAGADWRDRPRVERPTAPRRFVFLFDYPHLASTSETIDYAARAIERLAVGGEEHMVASFGDGLRIEAPFTSDPGEILLTLERMRTDRSLFAGNFGHLTEHRFFLYIEALLDLLERVPGRKIVLLLSGPLDRDGFEHDVAFRRIAAMAAKSRTSIYPVDSRGITTPFGFQAGDLGGPVQLGRLAMATGGRLTHGTNDLTLGYARAQRDLSCTYTLGIHDRRPRLDRARRIGVFVRQRGVRVIHADSYVLRSSRKRRRSLVHTALMAPREFDGTGLQIEFTPLRPHSPRGWENRIAVDLGRVPPAGNELAPEWEVRGVIRKPSGGRVRSFRRRIEGRSSPVHIAVKLTPGPYTLNVVVSNAALDEPLAREIEIHVPPIPIDRPSGDDVD